MNDDYLHNTWWDSETNKLKCEHFWNICPCVLHFKAGALVWIKNTVTCVSRLIKLQIKHLILHYDYWGLMKYRSGQTCPGYSYINVYIVVEVITFMIQSWTNTLNDPGLFQALSVTLILTINLVGCYTVGCHNNKSPTYLVFSWM